MRYLCFLGNLAHFGTFVHSHKNAHNSMITKYFHTFKNRFRIARTQATRCYVKKFFVDHSDLTCPEPYIRYKLDQRILVLDLLIQIHIPSLHSFRISFIPASRSFAAFSSSSDVSYFSLIIWTHCS